MIGLTKFFMGADSKCYLVKNVRTVKLVTLICTRDGSESDLLLGDDVCSQFEPAEASFEPFVQKQDAPARPADKPDKKKPVRGPCKKRAYKTKQSGKCRSRVKSSQFKGVKKSKKPYADGRDCYEANYYNAETKKAEFLGCFDNEYLAAATYQERAGNKEEAQRLRNLAAETSGKTNQQRADFQELIENNPDRPPSPGRKKKGVTVYVCKRCGLKYQSKGTCAGCGDNDMRKTEEEVD